MITLLTAISCAAFASAEHVLHLKSGKVVGFDHETEKGDIAEVFLNIPYAQPPVEELRFEKPKPIKPWKNIRDGTAFGPACYATIQKAGFKKVRMSEDCLTLNIIRPKKEPPSHGFPILFWLHGGGYQFGSAHDYGYKGFAEIYVPNDIIVVTIQYRLGIYGFFSTGDKRMPGNLGLFDMAEALKFVHSNAKSFGGDPSRITAWGHSAGASAAGQLILSPVTRDLILRSIEMSGSPWCSWALGAGVANKSLQLAEVLGCDVDVKTCLKQKTVDEIYEGVKKVHPDEMVAAAPPKVSIVGVTNKEAAVFSLVDIAPEVHKLSVKQEDYPNWNRQKLVSTLTRLISRAYTGIHLEEIINDITAFYVDRGEDESYEFYIDRYTEFLSDLLFNVGTANGIIARRDAGWDVYAFILDHHNDAIWNSSIPKKLRGAAHASELPYANGVEILGHFEIDESEQVVAEVFRQSFVEFAKTGAPSNHHEVWLEVGKSLRYLRISPNPELKHGFFNESASFWRRMQEYGFDFTQLLLTNGSTKDWKEEL